MRLAYLLLLCVCLYVCDGHGWQQDHGAITSPSKFTSSDMRAAVLPAGTVASLRRWGL